MFEDHTPIGEEGLCFICGQPFEFHRVEHKADGDPCQKCGLPPENHRERGSRAEYFKKRRGRGLGTSGPSGKGGKRPSKLIIGVDGEGQGRHDHRYIMLCASSEKGGTDKTGKWPRQWVLDRPEGIKTQEALDFLLDLPRNSIAFGYSINYDLTKILVDLPDRMIFALFRPNLRRQIHTRWHKIKSIHWIPDYDPSKKYTKTDGYWLNLVSSKFAVKAWRNGGLRQFVVWDIFKFFQSKFTNALTDWKVGDKEKIARMVMMKDKRAEFDKESKAAVMAYCLEECRYMAELTRRLIEAHKAAGLKLKSFYGAGSSGAAMLDTMGIKERIAAVKPMPDEMRVPVMCGFFGGRFENSCIGPIDGTVWNYDISSAYPYHITFLPCLEHGRWEHVKDRKAIEETGVRAALCRYSLERVSSRRREAPWGPFPFREPAGEWRGCISFPVESGGGWVWQSEYLAGERLFPNVRFLEAWVYRVECDCQPFRRIPEYYCERCRIGKEGPGIVLKLGCNSCYGKLAQSVGRALYQSWIWAGLITAGCRAQVLDVLGLHRDPANLLMVATDGIYTRERIQTPNPLPTGTAQTGKPLGGWEEKRIDKGVFVARPGIYFPMHPTAAEIKDIRGRGVGKGVVLENWERIVNAYRAQGVTGIAQVANVSRFCGAKTTISYSPSRKLYTRSPMYGQWVTRTVELSFDPMPKRESTPAHRIDGDAWALRMRAFPQDAVSAPYDKRITDLETAQLLAAKEEALEQPDCDLSDYELE